MSYWLQPVAAAWSSLREFGMAEWLWIDRRAPGVHREAALPTEPSPGVTHVWGWAPQRWVRLRVDSVLPSGLAGALLTTAPPDGEAREVQVSSHPVETWPLGEDRIEVPESVRPAVLGSPGTLRVANLVSAAADPPWQVTLTPVQFIELDLPAAP